MQDRKVDIETLIEATQALKRKMLSAYATKKRSITPSQMLVVGHVFRNPGISTNETAAALKMTGSAVTQLVNGLVKAGYIKRERDRDDKRAHRLFLTARSKKRIAEYREKRAKFMLDIFKSLSDEEFKLYVALHKKLIASLEK